MTVKVLQPPRLLILIRVAPSIIVISMEEDVRINTTSRQEQLDSLKPFYHEVLILRDIKDESKEDRRGMTHRYVHRFATCLPKTINDVFSHNTLTRMTVQITIENP